MSDNELQELVDIIKWSIDYHANEREEGFRSYTFYFCAPQASQDALFGDPNVAFVRKVFEDIGLNPQPCDTIPHAFNLNRDYEEVSCSKCIREFGFTLPVSDDLEALAHMVELEHEGLVQFIIYDNEEE